MCCAKPSGCAGLPWCDAGTDRAASAPQFVATVAPVCRARRARSLPSGRGRRRGRARKFTQSVRHSSLSNAFVGRAGGRPRCDRSSGVKLGVGAITVEQSERLQCLEHGRLAPASLRSEFAVAGGNRLPGSGDLEALRLPVSVDENVVEQSGAVGRHGNISASLALHWRGTPSRSMARFAPASFAVRKTSRSFAPFRQQMQPPAQEEFGLAVCCA